MCLFACVKTTTRPLPLPSSLSLYEHMPHSNACLPCSLKHRNVRNVTLIWSPWGCAERLLDIPLANRRPPVKQVQANFGSLRISPSPALASPPLSIPMAAKAASAAKSAVPDVPLHTSAQDFQSEHPEHLETRLLPAYLAVLVAYSLLVSRITGTHPLTMVAFYCAFMVAFYLWHYQCHEAVWWAPFNKACRAYHKVHHWEVRGRGGAVCGVGRGQGVGIRLCRATAFVLRVAPLPSACPPRRSTSVFLCRILQTRARDGVRV